MKVVKVRHEVTAIHPERKIVSVRNLETGDMFEEYAPIARRQTYQTPSDRRLPV